MSRVIPFVIEPPTSDEQFRYEMAQLRYDHRAMRRKAAILVAFLPLFALLLAAEIIAGLTFYGVLTVIVVLTAYCL